MNPVITDIESVFKKYRMAPTAVDLYEQVGKELLLQKIEGFVGQGKPISFVMLGFPMKSPNNRDKVLGTMPDKGEELALKNLLKLNREVKQIYEPGVTVNIVSDGYAFSDVMEVPDTTVEAYNEASYSIVKGGPVEWYDLRDFYGNHKTISSMRTSMVNQFGITETELERRIQFDTDVNYLYRGMIKFLELDIAIRNYSSNSMLHKQAKKLAREMMFRNEAYSHLVSEEFNRSIRLSIHQSINNGKKYSFQLLPSPKAWTTPWHSAMVMEQDGTWNTIHKRDAERLGYRLVTDGGQPYYYEQVREVFMYQD